MMMKWKYFLNRYESWHSVLIARARLATQLPVSSHCLSCACHLQATYMSGCFLVQAIYFPTLALSQLDCGDGGHGTP